jgi:hypothetical protein
MGTDTRELQEDGRVILSRQITIRVPDEEEWIGSRMEGGFSGAIAQDLNGSASGPIKVNIGLPHGFQVHDGPGSFTGEVSPGGEYIFEMQTEPFDRNQSILISPSVQLRKREAGDSSNEQ